MSEGTILHLQRLSTEDGPGIRTTVFFKGCPLQCAWCHNPESISSHPQVQWLAVHCLHCNACLEACPQNCLSHQADGLHIDRLKCDSCGLCVEACPSGALEMLGRKVSVEEVLAELLKDRAFYERSGGGVTLSGGEPTYQPHFAGELLAALHSQGIHTALDTCGLCSAQTLERLLAQTDLVLYDLKLLDNELHRRFTGVGNQPILENLRRLPALMTEQDHPVTLWVRTPLIPGASAAPANLRAIGAWLQENLGDAVSRWELCAFNNLCRDQYTRLGLDWQYAATLLLTRQDLSHCGEMARLSGFPAERILTSGAVRPGDP